MADKTEGDGKGLVHVNLGMRHLIHDPIRSVEAGRSGADDGHAERGILGASREAGHMAGAARQTPAPTGPMDCPRQHCG